MKRLAIAMGVAGALALTAACAYDHRGPAFGPRLAVGYDGFYDDYYGPFYDGYWGNDGGFYYRDGEGRPFQRDSGGHFRRDGGGAGFHAVHGRGGPDGGRGGGDHH